ncbi:alpha-glucosidase C-terminal domain-containing protein [Paenibacillus sp. N4]|uniref:alpha-amylase family glycosyl hydrolase n=1 Tax=Paenibacillus vietnamensis TaxID=2590547 RepID=UPI001CD08AA7|nr:alpha-amylase family glycosyl hydrolase [Paenibacillus vietnamensis]MCA0756809.1 alpha-glucosidase C-terminal domain-containing protein [Paenibacillus vietnamensis]
MSSLRLRRLLPALLILLLAALAACSGNDGGSGTASAPEREESTEQADSPGAVPASYEADEQPGSVFYEVFVRSFYDTNGDGVGDLNGVTAKLDYLKELGIGGIWLMPITASPSYHGYDTTDYYAVNPEYGTLDDLKKLTEEAHKRDIKVIMDLAVNHTGSEHPWFKEALADPGSPYRSWYTFKPAAEQAPADGAVDGNPWHAAGDSKYLGVFWGGMPDLNFDEPKVREEMIKIGRFWLEQGLDGFRLDAAKHIYGDFKSSVSTPEVQAANQKWWQEFRAGLNETNPDAYLIGEVWDSLAVIAPYFDRAFDSAFHFDLADRLISSARSEQDADLAFSLGRAYGVYGKASGGTFVDAPFLSNHDQNRVMTALDGNIEHAKMAAALLLTLPGTPYLYYGEEIGMKGAKPDEYIREPMNWYSDPAGGEGQTSWESSRYNAEAGAVSVEAQLEDGESLLSHYRELIKWRNEEPALRDGTIAEFKLQAANPKLSAYVRVTENDRVLVVHNLSGEPQTAELPTSDVYGAFTELIRSTVKDAALEEGRLTLPAYSSVILK